MSQTKKMLSTVARRIRINRTFAWFSRLTIVVGCVYGVLLIAAEALALMDFSFQWYMVAAVPVIAAALAVLVQRPISAEVAAHAVDTVADTKDLYLTTSKLDNAPGEYKPLVLAAAESSAAKIRPEAVAPFAWSDGMIRVAITLLVLIACTVLFSFVDLDPFGVKEERLARKDKEKELQVDLEATKKRVEAKKTEPLTEELSPKTEQILNSLLKEFDLMKPETMEQNHNKLKEQQKLVGQEWKKSMEQKLRQMERSNSSLSFGQFNSRANEWKKQFERGEADELKQELKEAAKLAEDLKKETDPEKQQELRKELEKKLKELAEFAKQNAAGSEMEQALSKALQQLRDAKTPEMREQAMEALQASLELAELDVEKLAQQMRDSQELQKMMDAINMAMQANAGGQLNKGRDQESLKKLGDYIEWYEKICKECGECAGCNGQGRIEGQKGLCPYCGGSGMANGGGMGGPGRGRGNVAPEDETIDTNFKTEKEKVAIQKGKMLATWKEQEIPDAGEATQIYQDALAAVKARASEAILTEEIPPGYHKSINGYFKSIDEVAPKETEKPGQ